jgi:hypothetical protein
MAKSGLFEKTSSIDRRREDAFRLPIENAPVGRIPRGFTPGSAEGGCAGQDSEMRLQVARDRV